MVLRLCRIPYYAHRGVQRSLAYLIVFTTLALTFLQQARVSGGAVWDAANAAGLLAFAGMLYLFLEMGAGKRSRVHRHCAYAVALLCVMHIVIMLTANATTWAYLTWDAPPYMWTGLGGALLLLLMVPVALPRWRRRWHANYKQFARWHYGWSLLVVGLSAHHILGSGYYYRWPWEGMLLLALIAAVLVSHRAGFVPQASIQPKALWLVTVLPMLFVALKRVLA